MTSDSQTAKIAEPQTTATRTSRRYPDSVYLVVISAALALDAGSVAIVNAALPSLARSLNIASGDLQLVVTCYAAVFAALLLLAGRAADRYGRRNMLFLGMLTMLAGSVVCALGNLPVVLFGRGLQGLGAALSAPPALSLVTELFPEGRRRNRALAVYTAVGAASFSLSLTVGGVVTELLGWRGVFWATAAIAMISAAGALLLPRQGVRTRVGLDLSGSAAAAAALILLVFAAREVSDGSGLGAGPVGMLVAAVLLAGWFGWHERRSSQAVLPARLLGVRPVQVAAASAVAFYTGLLGVLFFAPLLMQNHLHYSALQSALALAPMGITVVAAAQVTGRLLPRIGLRTPMVGGLVLIGGGVAWWSSVGPDSSYLSAILPAVLVMSVGQGCAFVALTAASLTDVPQREHGVAGAFNITAQQVGGSVGVAALVLISGLTHGLGGIRLALAAAAALCLIAAAIAFIALRPDRFTAGGLRQPAN